MRYLKGIVFALIGLLLLLVFGYALIHLARTQPPPLDSRLIFQGITYQREVRRDPYPLIYHIVTIDLDAPGVSFLVTPADDINGYDYRARTTSQFLEEFGLQLAVNGDFFDPWRDYGPWDYYPHEGDGVNVRGLTIAQSEQVSQGYAPESDFSTLYIGADNQVSFRPPEEAADHAISGLEFMRDGRYAAVWGDDSYLSRRHPRTVIALTEDARTMLIFVVDGRQPNYSEGIELPALTDLVIQYGGYNALNLDGGGSSTLVMEGEVGKAVQLGSAIHTHLPGRERPIANHLGIYARHLA